MLEQVKQPNSSLEALPAAAGGLSREAYALLAQANLLRVRGQWPEAVEACRAALRLAPDSAAAQSLLGDIYENQGDLDDAAQWYRMALDVNPESAADRLKLDRLLRRQDAPEVALPVSEVSLPPASPAPERALRYLAVAAALMILVVIGLAFAAVHRHAGLNSLGLGTDPEVKVQPVVVAPAAFGQAPPLRDSAEQSLLNTLNASPAFSAQSLTALDVQIDPRTGQCCLTVGLTSPSAPLRADIERAALSAALAAASAAGSASSFTIRCILPAGGGGAGSGGTLVFVGDIPRASLPPSPVGGDPVAALGDANIAPLFANVWWALVVPA